MLGLDWELGLLPPTPCMFTTEMITTKCQREESFAKGACEVGSAAWLTSHGKHQAPHGLEGNGSPLGSSLVTERPWQTTSPWM